MKAQLSLKAALALAEIFATTSDRCSKTGPRDTPYIHSRLASVGYEVRIKFDSNLWIKKTRDKEAMTARLLSISTCIFLPDMFVYLCHWDLG